MDAAYKMLKQNGVDIPNPPSEAHGEWHIVFHDLDGYEVEIEGAK